MLENKLIEHCAPTLAGMKSANLFSYFFSTPAEAAREIEEMNQKLNDKGVTIQVMKWRENFVLLYVYRKNKLYQEHMEEELHDFLLEYGYDPEHTEECIQRLKQRICESQCFPHEIGAFLGYPLEDVKGFIEHRGKNCKCCGFWKVYCNENEKQQQFERLKKCFRVYLEVFEQGRTITQMTVCA